MKTLQQLLEMKVKSEDMNGEEIEITPDFRMAVQGIHEEGIHVIVHPMGHNGDTLDLLVKGNCLSPAFKRPQNPPGAKPRGPWEPVEPGQQRG